MEFEEELEKVNEESNLETEDSENLPVASQNELVSLRDIHSKKFEDAKLKIAKFSKESKIEYQVKTVEDEGGLFGLFNHKVTGKELNYNLGEINKAFVGVNKSISKTIDEFKDIYNALDALDKDYIQRILVNLELTRRVGEDALAASNAAKLASDDALLANEKAIKNQNDLKNQHEALKLIVEKLKEKSEKIDELEKKIESISKENLEKIDKLENKVESISKENAEEIDELEKEIESISKENAEEIDELEKKFESISKENLEKIDELEKKIEFISKEKSSKKTVVAIIFSVISFLCTLAMIALKLEV